MGGVAKVQRRTRVWALWRWYICKYSDVQVNGILRRVWG